MTFTEFLANGGWFVIAVAIACVCALGAAVRFHDLYKAEKRDREYGIRRYADLYDQFKRLQANYDKAIKLGASAKLDAMWNATAARNQEKEVERWKGMWERMADRHGAAHERAEELQCKLDLERKRVTDLINYLTGAV